MLTLVLALIGVLTSAAFLLYCACLLALQARGGQKHLNTFFYKLWWNEGFIDMFGLTFFALTMYTRCFAATVSFFLSLNKFPWLTKFTQITQEHIMYIQITSVFLTVCGRLLSICFPMSTVTRFAEKLKRWQIFLLQISLPTLIVIPFYVMFNFEYGLKGIDTPLLLSTMDKRYDQLIFAVGLAYRVTAVVLCSSVYLCIFFYVRHKANRNEKSILIHAASLVIALTAILTASICRRFQIGEKKYPLMRVFFLTTMLWIPITNVFVTACAASMLRAYLLHPFSDRSHKSSAFFQAREKGCIDIFALMYFMTLMYTRCFDAAMPFFLSMNEHQWFTKFVQIALDFFMYTQITNVFFVISGRLLYICFPTSSATSYSFDIGLAYRGIALILCVFGYLYLFFKFRKRSRANKLSVLVHGASLVLALMAVLAASVCRRFRIGESYALMRLFYFTMILWIPVTNVFVTVCTTPRLRTRLLQLYTF
ncbi:hypothetical protein Q1695_007832 [Nippostrongylus brasiliensis]|nr:hypothetical protein Q1695_007832 [Nippostrongylus brasiliensis]